MLSKTTPQKIEQTYTDRDVTICVANVSKLYQIYDRPENRLKQSILPHLQIMLGHQPKKYHREFWALRDVSFEVRRGETIGITGRNGAGKSTLLQIICGTLSPSRGTVETNGRVAALLELGAGFNLEFTGRENVYVNARICGLSDEEIHQKFDDIVEFADIGSFLDQPVKTYSSGMLTRLAFAVQAQVDPDILLVDEALAVGDVKFQAKCFERIKRLKLNGTSILLVTHSSEQIVSHCDKAILIDNGCVITAGDPKHVVNRYLDLLFGKHRDESAPQKSIGDINVHAPDVGLKPDTNLDFVTEKFQTRCGYNKHEYRWGDRRAAILDFYLKADGVPYPSCIESGKKISLDLSIRFYQEILRPIIGVMIRNKEGVTIYSVNSETLNSSSLNSIGRDEQAARIEISFICRLAPGDYFISVGVASRHGDDVIPHDRRYDAIHISVRSFTAIVGLIDLELELHSREIEL